MPTEAAETLARPTRCPVVVVAPARDVSVAAAAAVAVAGDISDEVVTHIDL